MALSVSSNWISSLLSLNSNSVFKSAVICSIFGLISETKVASASLGIAFSFRPPFTDTIWIFFNVCSTLNKILIELPFSLSIQEPEWPPSNPFTVSL